MTPPPAPAGDEHGALSPRRDKSRLSSPGRDNSQLGGNPSALARPGSPDAAARGAAAGAEGRDGGSANALRPATAARGARPPAAHAAADAAEKEAVAEARALIDKVDEKLALAMPCACGVTDAVHECALASSVRRRWVLSVPPYVLWTDKVQVGARGRPRVVLRAFAAEDDAWDFQARLRGAYLLDVRAAATTAAAPPKPRARRRVELPEAPPAAGKPAAVAWADLEDAGGWGFDDLDEAGPATVPQRPAPRAEAQPKPFADWRVDPLSPAAQEETQEALEARYVGSRVVYDGEPGTVKGIEPHLDYAFLFNVRFDNGAYGDIELREIEDAAAAAAAAGHHPAAVAARPVPMQDAPVPMQDAPAAEVIVISDDEGDDAGEQPQSKRARRTSAPTPAPAAPAPRRQVRKAARPVKLARRPQSDASPATIDDDDDDGAAAAAAAVADTQPAAPVLEVSSASPAMLVRLSSRITLKLASGSGPLGKLGETEMERLMELLHDVDRKLLSAYLRFESHGDEKQLCAEWRALLDAK